MCLAAHNFRSSYFLPFMYYLPLWQYYSVMKSCPYSSPWHDSSYLQLKLYCIALFLCLAIPSPLFAYSQYCDASIARSHVELGRTKLEKSRLDAGTAAKVAITTNAANFSWLLSSEPGHSLSLSFDTLYTIMDFDSITAMTNGHLHTWGLSLSGLLKKNGAEIFYNVTPGISVSSNALKNPELINGESLQLTTSLINKKDIHQKYAWVLGFMSDYRFGDYRVYPLLGVCLQPSQDWLFQLALPDFSIRKTFSSGVNLTLYAAPEGNEWHVFSRDLQRNSQLGYNAIVTGITAHWPVTPTFEFSLDVEKHIRREFSIVLDDNSLIQPGAASGMSLTLTGKISF